MQEILYPLKVEIHWQRQEIIICTRKDLRAYDLKNGRMKFQYINIFEPGDEITGF